ncbi:MAG: hypothetical protein AAFQ89_21495, partial [Cyanobacteria bacterium J06626_18]
MLLPEDTRYLKSELICAKLHPERYFVSGLRYARDRGQFGRVVQTPKELSCPNKNCYDIHSDEVKMLYKQEHYVAYDL